jgi:hypothetical protein
MTFIGKALFQKRPLLLLILLWIMFSFTGFVSAQVNLTITPITWDVVGLDSNGPLTGPYLFPVGARVCNTSGAPMASVDVNFTWTSANANINL